ncbi:UDP-N-acetylmuramate--alanine ligase [Chitinasiproducens palmae]|uniref:UDP-N-acetylmuramate--alanine ligase n=1 Tax=Chitinasiproducens palmae TaxID=1770053 RepID=A0A1H2PSH9_9BURK|nr:UDP-N-acetylmuramate--alanine ligase [Chitinasiproducens palmae]SDV49542.1 hypothetical protein SAMN05216551_108172 [Chitinasiproducens palmae]
MTPKPSSDPHRLRDEIAQAAARLIAEEGLDFATAKRKGARQIVGEGRIGGDWMPDNEHVEDAVREYQSLFQSDTQPQALAALRQVAVAWMRKLDAFDPYVTGGVLNGIAGSHSDIHLQLFCDSSKDVAIFLLNEGIDYQVSETAHFNGRGDVETFSFIVRAPAPLGRAPIHLSLYDPRDLRGALKADERGKSLRANLKGLTDRMDEEQK